MGVASPPAWHAVARQQSTYRYGVRSRYVSLKRGMAAWIVQGSMHRFGAAEVGFA